MKKTKRIDISSLWKGIAFLFLFFFSFSVFSQDALNNFINNPLLKNANISLLVTDLKTNKSVCSYRPEMSVMPASTLKILTVATALELLGENFRFETMLYTDGELDEDGTLYGNLYVKGAGDPTLGSEKMGDKLFLTKWVDAVKQAGIKQVKGKLLADESIFDGETVNPKWTWEDMANYYAAAIPGISYMDNMFKLTLKSGKNGTRPEIIRKTPEIPDLIIENNLISTTIYFDSAYFYGAPYSNHRIIRGEIPANRNEFTIKGDIPHPANLLILHFRKKLEENGIVVRNNDIAAGTKTSEIYTHYSPLLSDIVSEINKKSNNHYAEYLFRYLSVFSNDKKTSTTNKAISVIQNYWKGKALPVEQLFLCDGSGLSPLNAISARFFVDLLVYMQTSRHKDAFFQSLPTSGGAGTLSMFLRNTPLQSRVFAKSGTLSRVKSYTGYIKYKNHDYAFALLVNNANGTGKEVTQKIERFLLEMVEE